MLLLLPSYKAPHVLTQQFVDQLRGFGVQVVRSQGCSDPALHRCLIAGAAMQRIREARKTGAVPWEFVLWLDDDMVASPAHVVFLREASAALGACVTGIYCKRGQPQVITIRHRVGTETQTVNLIADDVPVSFPSYPVTGGMGAMMLPIDVFEEHCRQVPSFVQLDGTGKPQPIPGVCASGMTEDDEKRMGWLSEDQCYCESLWHWANGVWSVPVVFGHISEVPLAPMPGAQWLMNSQSPIAVRE